MDNLLQLWVGTKKGAFVLESTPARRKWTLRKPVLFGHIVYHALQDRRDPKRMVLAAKTGHLGPTIYHSSNAGRSWKESTRPPAFPKAADGLSVDHTFYLAFGHASEHGVWYAASSPQGLFRSEDHGATWNSVDGFNLHPMRASWCGDPKQGPPDGARMHSILIDPRDPKHMYIGMSSGGVFETTDQGSNWEPLNTGCAADFLPDPNALFGHDPHCVRLHPLHPDRLYQQNHCGVYRLDRPETRWQRIGMKLPKKVGDVGFPMVLHPSDPDTAWVFPMDGTTVWPRTSVGGKPAAYVTRNGGKSWTRQDQGFPQDNAWWTVFRQAMTADQGNPLGLYAGTTSGEVWASRTEGERWQCLARHLPRIQSVEVVYR